MIRFTWLRFRAQALVALGALAVLAAVLLVTGIRLADAYDTAVAACKLHNDCAQALELFPSNGYLTASNLLHPLVIAVPCVLGMFWGAPLAAREFETGTFRLAWTQGVTRTRWLAIKIGFVGLFSMAVAGLLTLMATWWFSPFDSASMDRLNPANFHSEGIVPVGYAAFAFALGFAAGVLIRRTLPAMAVTLVIFTAAQFAVPVLVRPHLIAPVQTSSALSMGAVVEMGSSDGGNLFVMAQPAIPGAWILSDQIVTPAGRPASTEPATEACGGQSPAIHACPDYINSLHLRETVTYQPLSHYWPLQWCETAIYFAVALILAGLCFLRIRPARSAERNSRIARPSPPVLALRR